MFLWHKRFRDGTEDVDDDERQNAPVTNRMHENVEGLVRCDRRLTCRITVDELDMSKEAVREILIQDLGIRKLAEKLVQRNWTDVSLCAWTLWSNLKIICWSVSSLVMKHGVTSMIPRPNASPWSVDRRIPPGQGCQSPRSKQC
jgi:hypothetical protein